MIPPSSFSVQLFFKTPSFSAAPHPFSSAAADFKIPWFFRPLAKSFYNKGRSAMVVYKTKRSPLFDKIVRKADFFHMSHPNTLDAA